jgi:tRNA A37 threonylcarbamoyladenosine dehydratase
MADHFIRTRLLVGEDGFQRLRQARVAVFGLGGVGGYALEALARASVGYLVLVDSDVVEATNLNRQVLALHSTLGLPKVEVGRERARQINPGCIIEVHRVELTPENVATAVPTTFDYAIEAIDTVAAKVALLALLHGRGVRLVSCMGAASKLDPAAIRVGDISETKGCPLARIVRQGLRKAGIEKGIRCVYSEENLGQVSEPDEENGGRRYRGTISYMPGLAGLTAAGLIIKDILSM